MADPNLKITVSGDTSKADAALDKLEQHGEKIAKSVGAGLGTVFNFNQIAAAADRVYAKVAPVVKDVIALGSAALETQNLIDVTFGEMSDSVETWAKASSASLVQTTLATENQAATFYRMYKNSGMASDKALEMAKSMTELTGDMSSFYNLKPAEAFQKLQAAISGEMEPLKRLGIFLNEAAIKQEAYASGIAKVGETLNQNQKSQAIYNLILQQTQEAQGDLVRTQDGYANSLRTITAKIEQYKTDVGLAVLQDESWQAAMTKFKDIIARIVNSGDPEKMAAAIGDIADAIVTFIDLVEDVQPYFNAVSDFLTGKWMLNSASAMLAPFRKAADDAEEMAESAKQIEETFGGAAENVEAMSDDLKEVAEEAKKIAAERKADDEEYYSWKEWREKTYAEKRKAAYDSMMKHIEEMEKEQLERVKKELEIRNKILQSYIDANESAKGWMEKGNANINELANAAKEVGKWVKHGADSADRMNVATMVSSQNVSVMADEMEQTAVAAERVKSAVLFTELARSSFTKPMDWEGTLRKKGIGTGSMDQLELAQIQYTRQMQELGPLQFGARMDTQSVLWALQLAIQDLQLSLREQQIKGQTKPAGTRENPIYIEAADPGNSATLIGVA